MSRKALLSLALAVAGLGLAPAARSAATIVPFRCGGGTTPLGPSIMAMENEYIAATGFGACWFHTGHHTYDAGAPHKVGSVSGSVFSVEILFSPPDEYYPPLHTALTFETSLDGLSWTPIAQLPYIIYQSRQAISFSFDAGGHVARYFRIRQPRSLAQGLSGFLDSSNFDAVLEPVAAPAPGAPVAGSRSLACSQHVMERFFVAHPCWFGGINRYDSPSVFHTYPLGPSTLDRVSGTAIVGPWRTDDYFFSGGSNSIVRAFVQRSVNGVNWTTIGSFQGRYGTPLSFDFDGLGGVAASYLRIVPEYHKGVATDPPLKHARGFLIDSSVQLAGAFSS